MKNFITLILFLFLIPSDLKSQPDKVDWMYYWEAEWNNRNDKKHNRTIKKTLVFLFDEENIWCWRMRQEVFMNNEIALYINKNFYPVFWHIDNYQKEVTYNTNHIFDTETNEHDFVKLLTKGKMAFPYVVVLNEDLKIIRRIPGFQKVRDLTNLIRF